MVKPPALGTRGTKTSSHCPGRNCHFVGLCYGRTSGTGIYPYCVFPGDLKPIYAGIVVDLIYSFQGDLV